MVDPLMGYEIGKNHIEAIRCQMEIEHYGLAECVKDELIEEGYPCEIVEDGFQRFGGIKVKKWIIICKDKSKDPIEFKEKKDKITRNLAKMRQKTIKIEKKELKKRLKNEKKKC
jgi:hypothetical protein